MPAFKLSPKAGAELARAILDYDTARDALGTLLEDIASDWEAALEAKSETWKAGEAGAAATEATDSMRAAADSVPDVFEIDLELPAATPRPDLRKAAVALFTEARSKKASAASARRVINACRDLGMTLAETRYILTWLDYYDGADKPVSAAIAEALPPELRSA